MTTHKRIALVTGANQGVGKQVAKELAANGVTVLLGSRNFERGEVAAKEINAIPIQLDVTDPASIAAAAERIRTEFGRLDLLVNNAAISRSERDDITLENYRTLYGTSTVSLDDLRAIWETNVFGALAVYQAMLPLLRLSSDARIVNVSSGVGSLTLNADPSFPYRKMYTPAYAGSKSAMNIIALSMMIEHENDGIKVNLVSPEFTKTALNNFQGTETIEDGSREVVRVALFGPDDPGGTYTRWENQHIPW
ncbi:SDR family NAD(P)-dependent oxidoreductase [Chitinophaga sancti]|uniref:NADP-dependent 3-hydroxy acid dehydrogenase YdfG n=1 Tax=Chitinophaga sancti TaxID=1004 RepID=A0A1K1M716_9BACT|nr:SDR family NAD(P)-dependent oxidoreductase [Chitinophaga sancti]WQD64590.1 SDR family NAD(P)-dependent oxidoreductase [Chitinophaga sancti]WQG89786.1 SDR family NAD(P)-dependent oxidoreductase [Chitinophaga sancti]SFW18871.1 NADP-dependent 3-hydroxy acid dehydrogenase YdfG [Chitinophaga sancti]